jgi:flavin reductase (DIM6/NTAB) family NADH-FMN oxidoreductase RutF
VTAGALDLLVRSLDAAMVVVTTSAAGERAGCLVGFHAQASIHPWQYAVWLSKANHTYRVALLSEHLAVHVLDHGERPLAELFGGVTGDEVDKFARCDWHEGPGGVPLLDRCPNHIVLRRSAVLDVGGDHACVVGAPVEARHTGSVTPLRYADVAQLEPGHDVDERPCPPTERAG